MKIEKLLASYIDAKHAKNVAEENFRAIECALKEALGDTLETSVYTRKTWFSVTYKPRKGAARVDGKALARDFPDIYARYLVRAADSRPLYVKIK